MNPFQRRRPPHPALSPKGEREKRTSALTRPLRDKELGWGYNALLDEKDDPTGIGLGVFKLKAGQSIRVGTKGREAALVSFSGKGVFKYGAAHLNFERSDWESQAPSVVHVPAETELWLEAETEVEAILCAMTNPDLFDPKTYRPFDVQNELRGQGTLEETATRIVRTVFDIRNAPGASKMVLGEVVNFPGKWSSYPPHRHAQPEVYYYRFKKPQGYGHGELGEEVYKVRDRDVLRITDSRGHSQTAAPGYAMYYLWAVRHLPGRPYTGFTYYPEHEWTLQAKNQGSGA